MKKIIQSIILIVLSVNLYSQTTLYFTGAVNSNWSTSGNWSLTSGGTSSGTIPNSNIVTVFDINSPKCKIEASLTAKKIILETGFADTIIIKDSIIIVVTDTVVQKSGIINSQTATISLNKGLLQTGGSFYASKATTSFGTCIKIEGNFYHNNGKVMFDRLTNIYSDVSVYNFDLGGPGGFAINIAQDKALIVENDLRFINPTSSGTKTLNGPGKINIKKDLYQTTPNGTLDFTGSMVLVMNGTGDQNIYGNNLQFATFCNLPKIEINKPSGTLFFNGIISSYGGFDLVAGNVDASTNSSTVQLIGSQTYTNPISFYNLNILSHTTSTSLNVNTGADITVLNDLKLVLQNNQNSRAINGPGKIKVQGDLYQAIPNGSSNFTGNVIFRMTGENDQHIIGNNDLVARTGELHRIEIDKPSGILYLQNAMASSGGFDLINGTVEASTYNSTVQLVSSSIFTNDFTFNNLIIYPRTATAISISINQGKKLTVLGNLSFNSLSTSSSSYSNVNGPGTIELFGNLTTIQEGLTVTAGGGNAQIKLVGSTNQSIIGNNTEGLGRLPSILVDKPSGLLLLEKKISLVGDFEVAEDTGTSQDSTLLIMYAANAKLSSGNNLELYAVRLKNKPVLLSGNLNLRDGLYMGPNDLYLNDNNLTINNSSPSAINYSTGGILMDAKQFATNIKWKSSNTVDANYTIPFKTASLVAIPYNFVISSAGNIANNTPNPYSVVSMYTTGNDNLPYPPLVDSLLDTNGINNISNVLDRYYRMSMEGFETSPTYDVKCRYINSEFQSPNTILEGNIKIQMLRGTEMSQPIGSVNTTLNEITIYGIDRFGGHVILVNGQKPVSVKPKTSNYYASLTKILDAGYYEMTGNVNFVYKEKYSNNLNYKVYSLKREIVMCSDPSICSNIVSSTAVNKNGVNYHVIPSTLYLNNNEFYIIEITNEKGEKYMMKFRYTK